MVAWSPILASATDYGYAVALQPDGKVIAGGYAYNGTER